MNKLFFAGLGATALTAAAFVSPSFADDHAEMADISAIESGTYELDKTHAYVTASYSHMGFSHPILRFDSVDSTIELNAEEPTETTLSVTIDPASINSGVERFDSHLKSGDMFDVEKFDTITFTSTELTMESSAKGTLTGDLTMKGITKPVTLDVTLNKAGDHPRAGKDWFGISATGMLDRSEWDLGYAAPAVGAEVSLVIEAEYGKAE